MIKQNIRKYIQLSVAVDVMTGKRPFHGRCLNFKHITKK